MAFQANNRNVLMRNERTMPSWVTEQTSRIGPKPPPPPLTPENGHGPVKQPALPPKTTAQPEPDYEVIEFSHQQYSNAPVRPSSASSGSKTPDSKLKCTLCGSGNPWVTCEECSQQIFCASCDDMFHKHPKRKAHQRKTLEQTIPPLPPKILPGQPGPSPPVAPPRRNKRGFMTPLMQRKDQVNSTTGQFAIPPSPTPSMRNASWQDRMGSLTRSMSILNRPLPETPKTSNTPSESSRCTTPKSAFDNIQRPPSVVLEKIKTKANATLDRMQLLQQRYRQQKEQMGRDRGVNGNGNDQHAQAFDQWSNISPSPSHFRSGSMSSGINSSHLDLTDDSSFNLFHQRQNAIQHHKLAAQRANQLGQRGMSSSVFNLNQTNRKPPVMNNGWMNNPMQQAQSMAQLNCANCSHPQQPPWGVQQQHMHMAQDPWSNQLSSQQHLNRSNLSLNIGAGYMMQPPHNGMYPPPVFMNQRGVVGQMFPQPYMGGMPVMNPGLPGMPPSVSRAASRAGSRMGSPAMSRKSVTLRRKQRSSYREDEGTDDEDSDEDDRRSMVSNRSGLSRTRQRRMSSASQMQLDEDMDAANQQRVRARTHRRDSIAKSVHSDWAPGRKPAANNNRSADSGFNSPLKPSRIYSDLESEGSGTRALVQAKIEQKLKEESLKQQKQSKSKRRSESPPKQKHSAAVQTPTPKVQPKPVEHKVEKAPTESESEEEEEEEVSAEEVEEEVKEPEVKAPEIEQATNEEPTAEELELPIEDEVYLGPPPSTPDQEWECEFCTFVNEPNIKICTICCKTPSKPPKLVAKSSSPPKQVKTSTSSNKGKESQNETPIANETTKPTNNTQPSASSSSKVDSSQSTDDTATPSTTSTLKKKESLEDIWATLDENIQATASEVTRKAESSQKPTKVSTGCGTSSKSASVERQDVELQKSQAREIGTSPPPQTISTQTYETLPLRKSEAKEESPQLSSVKPSQSVANDSMQQSHFPPSNNIQDMKSFETEVLNNIHNISHIPSPYQYQHHQPFYPSHERHQRYRSNNDLRMDDTMSLDFDSYNGMGRRHPSISELLLLQRNSSQMHSPLTGSSYDLSYRHNGMDNHKESDLYKHTAEELNAALKYCGPDMHPLVWLRDNWPKLIQTVQSLATKYGQERSENTIGTISQMEAREALRMHTGNIWQAVSECIEQRQRKYREISSKGNFSREDVVTALTTHQGNVDMALMDLGRTQLKPFLMRIWGSPAGVENESGAMIIPPSPQSPQNEPYAMDKDIHNFLSANASDCMQIPNATGAFTPNNQTPSPFDLPASLSNPYELNNPIPDNTSSYSADSNKDYAHSPLQVDDSILHNKGMLKDLESLIGTMEQNQQKQNEHVLRSIQDMLSNMKQDNDPEAMRILTKSPIASPKSKNPGNEKNPESEADVKNFVWQHIQEIVPNLVQQVEMELREDTVDTEQKSVEAENHDEPAAETPKEAPPPPPPIDQDEFLMEEVIRPNLKNATIREELPPQYAYTAEIATFQLAFDKGLQREHKQQFEFDSLEGVRVQVFKMYKAPELEVQLQPTASEESEEARDQNIPATIEDLPMPDLPKATTSQNIPTTVDELPTEAPIIGETLELPTESQVEVLDLPNLPSVESSIPLDGVLATPAAPTEDVQAEQIPEPTEKTLPTVDMVQNEISDIQNNQSESAVTEVMIPAVASEATTSNLSESPEPVQQQIQQTPATNSSAKDKPASSIPVSVDHEISIQSSESPETDNTTITQLPVNDNNTASTSTTIPQSQLNKELPKETTPTSTNEDHDANAQSHVTEGSPLSHTANLPADTPPPLNASEIESPLQTTATSSGADKKQNTSGPNQRKMSKIPVRRTASNKSLVLAATAVPRTERNQEQPTPEPATDKPIEVSPTTSADATDLPTDEDSDEEELYSLGSEMSITENDSRADDIQSLTDTDSRLDDVQSPASTNEMFLMIQHDGTDTSMDESTIVPSTSSSTIHSAASFSSAIKSSNDFVPSGDPNKQNLSELVKDTQRLIKQMKDEISIDDFESSGDDDYTDDYSDDYDDEETETEEEDEEGEEEEEDDEHWEDEVGDGDEFDDVIGDMTEEGEVADDQQELLSNDTSPEPDHREHHNTSALSNASDTSKHSLPLSLDHSVNDDTTISQESNQTINTSNPNEESVAYVESENSAPEIQVEAVVSALTTEERQADANEELVVESENSVPELPVETVMVEIIDGPTDIATSDTTISLTTEASNVIESASADNTTTETSNVIEPASADTPPIITTDSSAAPALDSSSAPLSATNVVDTEPHTLPELPSEDTVLIPVTENLPLQTENAVPELPVEVVLPPAEQAQTVVKEIRQASPQSQSTPSIANNTTNASSSPAPSPSSDSFSLNNVHELPSTSGSMLSSTEPIVTEPSSKKQNAKTTTNKGPQQTKSQADDNKPSTSKQGAKPKSADSKKKANEDAKTSGKKTVVASKIPKPKESQKEQKPKETPAPAPKTKTEPKRMLPTRSKSFSGPPTPIGISSVKTISQRFLGQTQQKPSKPQTQKAPATVVRKSSITEAINKLTKPSTSIELPSTSNLFKARTQPRIPKKKYHETCFSDDDYETTSSEEELEALEIRQRKMSIPVFRAYPSVQEPEEINTAELVDKYMKEELVATISEAQIAAALVSMKFQQDVSIWAAKECSDLDHAIALLRQECELCSGTYALNEIVSMLKCTHKCCRQCAKTYFTVQITERSINDCNCPFCKTPDLHNQTEYDDENLEYFSNLDIYLKNIVEPEVHELFQRKLRDRTLLKDPTFKWCVQCSSGFFARPKQKRLICPDCGSVTCASCRKTWQKQHEGISCEKFLEWEMGNDPEVQALGVQQHLEQNGIDCPKCKFKYSLARGGCMHFTCTQCKFEFCYGCAKPFMMGAKCNISPYCAKLGLHAHHPRNCLFYLRDKLPVQLQILLKNNGVAFEVDPIEVIEDNDQPGSSQKQTLLCPIPIQKETPNGLVDTKCKGDVPDKHAGMCRTHYVEYLTAMVAKAQIDPLPIFDLTDCVQELRRRGIPLPERGPWDTDEIYKTMCAEVILKHIPLDIK